MIHELKIFPQYFKEVISGSKTFEVRKADRPFAVGDLLALNEFDPNIPGYTDNSCVVYVDYILKGDYCKDGYVIMAIKPCVVCKKTKPISQEHFYPDYSVPYATTKEDRPKERTLTIVRVRFNTKTDKTYDYEYIGNEPIALGDFVTVETAQGKKDVEILDIFHIKENEAEYDYKTATKED